MKDLILLSPKTGMAKRWQPPANFSFVQEVPLLPVQAAEAGRVASALPLALCKDESASSGWSLQAVCGKEPKTNVMVGDNGQWLGQAVPECIRYLPFALMDVGGEKALAGIDRRYAGRVLRAGHQSVPLYDKDGQLHEHARKRVEALVEHAPRIRRTQEVLAKLNEAGLIVPWPTSVLEAGTISIEGLHTIDEKKLSQLDDDAFLALRKSGALPIAYSCLLSLYQVRGLAPKASSAHPEPDTAVQTTGDIDLEFLNESETIKFGPLQ